MNFDDLLGSHIESTKSTSSSYTSEWLREVYEFDKNEFACEMVSENNLGQIIQVQVMLFNLYC